MLKECEFLEFDSLDFSCLIDARSPSEFSYSNLKNSINLYALNDSQREEIGILYSKNQSLAKLKGASYICENMSLHLDYLYDNLKVGSLVGIYCSRGGLRSKSIALILSEIGYRVFRLKGGYKSYRACIREYFDNLNLKLFSLCGNSACGKSELLSLMKEKIELEKLANHFGSVFGNINGNQPSQKQFDEDLFRACKNIKKFAFIELESRKIGDITIPLSLYNNMQNSFKILCECSLNNRIERIYKNYYSKISYDFFISCINKISHYISLEFKKDIINSYEKNDIYKVIEMLLSYYDKVYKKPKKIDYILNTDDLLRAKEELINLC